MWYLLCVLVLIFIYSAIPRPSTVPSCTVMTLEYAWSCSCNQLLFLLVRLIIICSYGLPILGWIPSTPQTLPMLITHIATAVNNLVWILYRLALSKSCCHGLFYVLIKTPINIQRLIFVLLGFLLLK